MKRTSLALLIISALLLPEVAQASKKPAPEHQIYGIRYGGGTLPYAESNLWIGVSVGTPSTSFYVSDKLRHHDPKANAVATYMQKNINKVQTFSIPSNSIKSITLSQDKHHRVGSGIALSVVSLGAGIPVMFTKSTKDYIELTWDDNGKKGAAEFQADKKDYRGLLTALSGASGVPVTAAVDTQGKK
jgi:hypothetical protein